MFKRIFIIKKEKTGNIDHNYVTILLQCLFHKAFNLIQQNINIESRWNAECSSYSKT
jgi:hypothetical protein